MWQTKRRCHIERVHQVNSDVCCLVSASLTDHAVTASVIAPTAVMNSTVFAVLINFDAMTDVAYQVLMYVMAQSTASVERMNVTALVGVIVTTSTATTAGAC